MSVKTWKDRMFAKLLTRYPALVVWWAKSHDFVVNVDIPWAPLLKDPKDSRIALVTTAGVHLRSRPAYQNARKSDRAGGGKEA